MDNKSSPGNQPVAGSNRFPVVLLFCGFAFLCMAIFSLIMNSSMLTYILFFIGVIGVFYGSIKIPKIGYFLLCFMGWFVISFYINNLILSSIYFDSPYLIRHNAKVVPIMFIIQLLGVGLAFFLFRRNKRPASFGIILSSTPYLLGFVFYGGCAGPGLPFPLSLIPC